MSAAAAPTVIVIDSEDWCWCADCNAPSQMKEGRCARCTSAAVAYFTRIQIGELKSEESEAAAAA